jgi:hypothetical protein
VDLRPAVGASRNPLAPHRASALLSVLLRGCCFGAARAAPQDRSRLALARAIVANRGARCAIAVVYVPGHGARVVSRISGIHARGLTAQTLVRKSKTQR